MTASQPDHHVSVRACNAVRGRLLAMYEELQHEGGWRAVGEALGVSGGMAYKVAREGYQPRDPEIRAKLGLPALNDRLAAELLEAMLNE